MKITVLDRKEELYMLGINAAYVGNEPEVGLAEVLGIPQALRRYTVTTEIKSEDGLHFAFDFEEVLRALDGVLETDALKGAEIAKHFVTGDRYSDSKPWPIFLDKDVSVTLVPGRVESRFVYDKPGEAHDTWTVEGSVLRGLLSSSYEDESKKEPPTIILTVSSAQNDSFGYSQPVWDEDLKFQIDFLSNQIAEALKKI